MRQLLPELTITCEASGAHGVDATIAGVLNLTDVIFNADTETLNGNITCDGISTIVLNLKNNTTLTGAIDTENTNLSFRRKPESREEGW